MPTMSFRVVGNVLVIANRSEPPPESEWDALMEKLRALDARGEFAQMRLLVFSEGGGPNTMQRKQFTDLLAGRTQLTAVVTDSMVARGIVTAMSWFNPMTRAFASGHMSDALRFLQIDDAAQDAILHAASDMHTQIGLKPLARGARAG